MKIPRILCFASITILSLLIAFGCDATKPIDGDFSAGTDIADIKEGFLTIYLTTNYEGRYDALLKAIAVVPDESATAKMEKAMETYYVSVRNLVSDACYDTLVANRDIYRYDKHAFENNEIIQPTNFVFTEYSVSDGKTTYAFEASLEIASGDQVQTGKVSGQITVEELGGKELVSNLYISKTGIVYDT